MSGLRQYVSIPNEGQEEKEKDIREKQRKSKMYPFQKQQRTKYDEKNELAGNEKHNTSLCRGNLLP